MLQLDRISAALADGGAMEYTTVVAALDSAPLGERYAVTCAACCLGERIRDAGGHALVVLDDISCMVRNLFARIDCGCKTQACRKFGVV